MYVISVADISALNKVLDSTYTVRIESVTERGDPPHNRWRVFAPSEGYWHTGDGSTILEAAEAWMDRSQNFKESS